MSMLIGGLLTLSGVVTLFKSLNIKEALREGGEPRFDDTKLKQIGRIASNVLKIIGNFALAIGLIAMGATIFSVAPTLGFLDGVMQALSYSWPYLAASLAGLSVGHIIDIGIGTPMRSIAALD